MPPKLKRARATGAAAVESSTESDAPPAKRAKERQPVVAAPAAPVHASSLAASSSSSILPPDADDALKDFQRACKQTKLSAELTMALVAQEPAEKRLQSATKLLLEDEARDDGPFMDLSHRVRGKGSLLMLIIETYCEILKSCNAAAEAEEVQKLKDADTAFATTLPHVCTLIRSSYDTTIKRPDGKDALALLTSLLIPLSTDVWSYQLAEASLDRGANVNTRFNGGCMPLIRWSLGVKPPMDPGCAVGPLLLLQHGAGINARSDDGTTCAHAIAMGGNHPLAMALAEAGWLAAADLTLLDNNGETALQVAQRMLVANPDEGGRQSDLRIVARSCNVVDARGPSTGASLAIAFVAHPGFGTRGAQLRGWQRARPVNE
jgi:hypothetical protein